MAAITVIKIYAAETVVAAVTLAATVVAATVAVGKLGERTESL